MLIKIETRQKKNNLFPDRSTVNSWFHSSLSREGDAPKQETKNRAKRAKPRSAAAFIFHLINGIYPAGTCEWTRKKGGTDRARITRRDISAANGTRLRAGAFLFHAFARERAREKGERRGRNQFNYGIDLFWSSKFSFFFLFSYLTYLYPVRASRRRSTKTSSKCSV